MVSFQRIEFIVAFIFEILSDMTIEYRDNGGRHEAIAEKTAGIFQYLNKDLFCYIVRDGKSK